jgi:hypothetical protein
MGNEKEVSEMLKEVAKLVLFGITVTVFAVALVSGQVKKQPDLLADWAYPKAKRGLEGTSRPPLIWTKFTTTDPFEKVWEFYWQKVTRGAPISLPSEVKSGTLYGGPPDPKKQTVCAHYRDENPAAKFGVFVIREHQRTVSVTIVRRAKERETTIIVVLDQR